MHIHSRVFGTSHKKRQVYLPQQNIPLNAKANKLLIGSTPLLRFKMSADDYQVSNLYKYTRKTYKKNRNIYEEDGPGDNIISHSQGSPRTEVANVDPASCSCEIDPDSEIANLLHKKCPVIALAQQQMQRILGETDRMMCNHHRNCRLICRFWSLIREFIQAHDTCKTGFIIMTLVAIGFIAGVIIGAGSCGSYLGQFNSPIFTCIDNYFLPDNFHNVKDSYRSIV